MSLSSVLGFFIFFLFRELAAVGLRKRIKQFILNRSRADQVIGQRVPGRSLGESGDGAAAETTNK